MAGRASQSRNCNAALALRQACATALRNASFDSASTSASGKGAIVLNTEGIVRMRLAVAFANST